MSYIAPLKDMLFDIEHLANIAQVAQLPGFEDAGLETAQAVLEECAKLNEGVTAGLGNRVRGKSGLHEGRVPGNARRGQPQGKRHREESALTPGG